jgi:RNA polymerase sigma factor for flagellar operon FliA
VVFVLPTTRDQLITNHTDIARRIALKIARRCPQWMAREDLVAAGMRGLTEAADRYDATRAEPFLAFAERRIRGAVLDELRCGDLLPRRKRTLARRVDGAIRDIEKGGQVANDETVADRLGVTVDHYRSRLAHLVHVGVEPLEAEGADLDRSAAPDAIASHRQMLERLRSAFDQLEQRDAQILLYHYEEDLSYQEIAKILGITASRVCQLLWRAVDRLRVFLGVVPSVGAAA